MCQKLKARIRAAIEERNRVAFDEFMDSEYDRESIWMDWEDVVQVRRMSDESTGSFVTEEGSFVGDLRVEFEDSWSIGSSDSSASLSSLGGGKKFPDRNVNKLGPTKRRSQIPCYVRHVSRGPFSKAYYVQIVK